ncbi:hypothetical protein FA95DRAFT_1581282 [Auriscalpium vulgare]|uniref:Uncharacterized protein n=1 Tax=Auriscalpium vulgare TaxID=40419 RepID=A0ACB8S381_9AGAM|nr:hypothetical protein FA95DRAFT_1581282 [Auriscalpium vulgare]
MNTCRLGDSYYIAAGETRGVTKKTFIVTGAYSIQCCPFTRVDDELEYICRMAKQWIKSWRNPFATASWMHLIFARCHAFEDGNGRMSRMLASIPLMRHGFPAISITTAVTKTYYPAINEAYDGVHASLVRCMVQGMRETIALVHVSNDGAS